MKRRRRVEDARDESIAADRFDHSSQHADLQSLLEEHSYGADAETAMRAWIESRRRPEPCAAAEPHPRTQDELQRVMHTLESVDAERAERAIAIGRPEASPTEAERVVAPAP